MSYHGRIMNIPAEQTQGMCDYEQTIYKLGHRDARHAAAEIANEADALVAELLEALEMLLDDHIRTDPHHAHLCPLCVAASVAIAKAKS